MMKKVAEPLVPAPAVPNRWRSDRVDGRSAGSLFELIRRQLAAHQGVRTRPQLLEAIRSDPQASERLGRTQGFGAVLSNMKSSGFVELENEIVRATGRRVGRRRP